MPIELIDKIKPKNSGSFAMVDAQDVEMEDGTRLPEALAAIPRMVLISREEYEAGAYLDVPEGAIIVVIEAVAEE